MANSNPQWQKPRFPRAAWLTFLAASLSLGGCGNTLYAISANGAASRVEEARELSAEKYAPYEYYSAKAYLEKAQTEAAEADYGDATDLADTAEEFAERAIEISKNAKPGKAP